MILLCPLSHCLSKRDPRTRQWHWTPCCLACKNCKFEDQNNVPATT